jgi:hypothetical protein
MGLLVLVVGGATLGAAFAWWLARMPGARPYDDSTTRLLDVAAAWLLLTLAVWTATSWALSFPHWLSAPALTGFGLVEFAIGALVLHRSGALGSKTIGRLDVVSAGLALVALAPVLLWVAFVAWRGTLLPVYSHDALAYHMPKAVLLMKGHGLRPLDVSEARIATWPCNYEMLLADTMLLSGGDHYTAAIGTFSYAALLVFAARLASASWGGGFHAAVVAAVTAATPIAILHSGLHKNDLLNAVFVLAALGWSARWLASGCASSAVLATMALVLSVGTKVSAVPIAIVPLLALGALRHHREQITPRWVARLAALGAVAFLFLGGWPYALNLLTIHRLVLPDQVSGGMVYGVWSNLWEFTLLLVMRPFYGDAAVWNPVRGTYWWWPSNDIWMSHYGAVFSVLAALLIPCIAVFLKRGSRLERAAASLGALAIYAAMLPIAIHPAGFFAHARFLIFVVPVVALWTISPLVRMIEESASWLRVPVLAMIAVGVASWGARSAFAFGVHDAYAPIEYVEYMMDHPDNRVPFVRRNRAASVFDANAGPAETCAMDVGFDTWVYPAYGAHWTRTVEFLKPAAGEVAIPDDASWILVDRSWNVFFGHPKFTDMGQARYLGRGRPTDDDLKVYRQLARDPRFALVYEDRSQNQAVFRRK